MKDVLKYEHHNLCKIFQMTIHEVSHFMSDINNLYKFTNLCNFILFGVCE